MMNDTTQAAEITRKSHVLARAPEYAGSFDPMWSELLHPE
jgi:hypothetical protein